MEKLREVGKTLTVNAALEEEKEVLKNVPWLVELDL
jgi:hypothetical protein